MDNTQKIWYQDYNLEPLDAEFSAEQHIQNPLNSFLGKSSYNSFNFKIYNLQYPMHLRSLS